MKKIPTFIKNFMKNTTIQEISSAVLWCVFMFCFRLMLYIKDKSLFALFYKGYRLLVKWYNMIKNGVKWVKYGIFRCLLRNRYSGFESRQTYHSKPQNNLRFFIHFIRDENPRAPENTLVFLGKGANERQWLICV